ncbi:GIY-YIG nuclease family protein [Planktothricoides raciborskii]|uniref:GIY-YIG nuclease family protein n=1 Tax=Planktothricoides raciborskii GIHE-MW2 TaxID=2792601 RepID=A0AAU8JAE2_9CYAN
MREGEVRQFTSSNVDSAPDAGGIYAIYDETAWDMVAYIGRSNNIRRRLKEHLSGRGSKSIDTLIKAGHDLWFSFGYSDNPHGSEAAELARLSPAGNRKREVKYLEDF